MTPEAQEVAKNVADYAAAGVAVGSIMTWLPPLAAAFTIVWTGLRIYIMVFGPIYKPPGERKPPLDD